MFLTLPANILWNSSMANEHQQNHFSKASPMFWFFRFWDIASNSSFSLSLAVLIKPRRGFDWHHCVLRFGRTFSSHRGLWSRCRGTTGVTGQGYLLMDFHGAGAGGAHHYCAAHLCNLSATRAKASRVPATAKRSGAASSSRTLVHWRHTSQHDWCGPCPNIREETALLQDMQQTQGCVRYH